MILDIGFTWTLTESKFSYMQGVQNKVFKLADETAFITPCTLQLSFSN